MGCQVEASHSLTARRCMTKERQMKDQGKIKIDERKVRRYPPSPPPTASPRPLSTMRAAPRVPRSPSPRPRWRFHLPPPPVGLTSVVVRKTTATWLHCSSRDFGAISSPGRAGLVSSTMAAQRVFCWHRHRGRPVNRASGRQPNRGLSSSPFSGSIM